MFQLSPLLSNICTLFARLPKQPLHTLSDGSPSGGKAQAKGLEQTDASSAVKHWGSQGSIMGPRLSGVNREGGLRGRAGAPRMAERPRLADELLQPPVLHVAPQQLCPVVVAQLRNCTCIFSNDCQKACGELNSGCSHQPPNHRHLDRRD